MLRPSMLMLMASAAISTAAASPLVPWWQHGSAPYALQVPANLASLAKPMWSSASARSSSLPQYIMARRDFSLAAGKTLKTAVAFVTAQMSPFAQPDPRLATTELDGDYGASIPRGGSSQPRLLGGYKLLINGRVVGTGPGRLVNQTQGVDAIDILSLLNAGGANAVGIQGFHTSRFKGFNPRLLFLLKLEYSELQYKWHLFSELSIEGA